MSRPARKPTLKILRRLSTRISLRGLRRLIWVNTLRRGHTVGFLEGRLISIYMHISFRITTFFSYANWNNRLTLPPQYTTNLQQMTLKTKEQKHKRIIKMKGLPQCFQMSYFADMSKMLVRSSDEHVSRSARKPTLWPLRNLRADPGRHFTQSPLILVFSREIPTNKMTSFKPSQY